MKGFSLFCLSVFLCCASFVSVHAEESSLVDTQPVDELYWRVLNFPAGHQEKFGRWRELETYKGAYELIDYACDQYTVGMYQHSLSVKIALPSRHEMYCRVRYPLQPQVVNGTLYTAQLYCNGEARNDINAEDPCGTPESPEVNKNQGLPYCSVDLP